MLRLVNGENVKYGKSKYEEIILIFVPNSKGNYHEKNNLIPHLGDAAAHDVFGHRPRKEILHSG